MTHRYESPPPADTVQVWRSIFERQKAFAEHSFDQLDDDGFFRVLAPGLNPVAVIAQHIAGNLVSRFTDFLTTDGEKPNRNRETEFELPDASAESRAAIMNNWGHAWSVLFATLDLLTPDDLAKTVRIRSIEHTVQAAMLRQLDHYAFHVGQINIIARQIVGTENWEWFTLPPGGTKAFNEKLMG